MTLMSRLVNDPRLAPQTHKGHATRAAILSAATTLYAFEGPTAVTMSRICRRAKMQRPAVYRYFPDARAVLAEVEEAAIRKIGALTVDRRYEPGPRRLRRFVSDMCHRCFSERETARLITLLWRERQEVRHLLDGPIRADLRAMGRVGANLQAKVMAAAMIGVMEAMLLREIGLGDLNAAVEGVLGLAKVS